MKIPESLQIPCAVYPITIAPDFLQAQDGDDTVTSVVKGYGQDS